MSGQPLFGHVPAALQSKCPCRECAPPKRKPGCHDDCAEYQEWHVLCGKAREARAYVWQDSKRRW